MGSYAGVKERKHKTKARSLPVFSGVRSNLEGVHIVHWLESFKHEIVKYKPTKDRTP